MVGWQWAWIVRFKFWEWTPKIQGWLASYDQCYTFRIPPNTKTYISNINFKVVSWSKSFPSVMFKIFWRSWHNLKEWWNRMQRTFLSFLRQQFGWDPHTHWKERLFWKHMKSLFLFWNSKLWQKNSNGSKLSALLLHRYSSPNDPQSFNQ